MLNHPRRASRVGGQITTGPPRSAARGMYHITFMYIMFDLRYEGSGGRPGWRHSTTVFGPPFPLGELDTLPHYTALVCHD